MDHGAAGAANPVGSARSACGARAEALRARLSPRARRAFAGVHVLVEVDSTNRWLVARPNGGTGEVCIAGAQIAGRGRRGRTWQSPAGGNVYFSAGWRFVSMGADFSGLGLVAGVVAAEAIARQGIRGVGLKWPNDLVCDRGKLGGVLVEASIPVAGEVKAVIGIGINLAPAKEVASVDQPVADLQSLAGRPVEADGLIVDLMEGLAEALPEFAARGLAPFRDRWSALDRLAGQPVRIHEAGGESDGVAQGIDEQGALRVRMGGALKIVRAADVSVRPRP